MLARFVGLACNATFAAKIETFGEMKQGVKEK